MIVIDSACARWRPDLSVHLGDRSVDREIAVLLVHVVLVSPAAVPKPDAVVLHGVRVLLEDLIDREHLATSLLRLAHLLHEVPELALGKNWTRRRLSSGRSSGPAS